jgi:hypothetical protein
MSMETAVAELGRGAVRSFQVVAGRLLRDSGRLRLLGLAAFFIKKIGSANAAPVIHKLLNNTKGKDEDFMPTVMHI